MALKNLFSKKKTLDDVTLDDLKREKIRLENEEGRFMRRAEDVEGEKKTLFLEGAKEGVPQHRRVLLARKIKERDAEAVNLERNLQMFSKQLRIINGFIMLKENQRIMRESGISSIISKVDLQDLQIYVDQATIEGSFHMEKFSEMLGALEGADQALGKVQEDDDIQDLVRQMEAVATAEDPRQAYEEAKTKAEEEKFPEDKI